MVVVATVPPDGVKEIGVDENPDSLVSESSKSVGGVITIGLVPRLVPATV